MKNILKKVLLTEEIQIKHGKIIGKKINQGCCKEVNCFLGIPFAKPPIGELRFKKPLPPDPWNNILYTTSFGARSIQYDSNNYGSENCLYLNVFSPALFKNSDLKKFAVLIFIHGGGFTNGSADRYGDIGIAQHLVAECETVVVTIQYRLGYLGFFSTGDDACDDNVGLWDCTMALQWVQDNIEAFHGDKNNVTVFGQSAGGVIADLLSISPISRNLFHKVIPMAGNANATFAINKNVVETCRRFAFNNGITTTDTHEMVKQLRTLNSLKFAKINDHFDISLGCVQTLVGPRLNNEFLPKSIEELRAEAPKKKRLIGVCEYEGIILYLILKKKLYLEQLETLIALHIPEDKFQKNFKKLREEALALYINSNDRYNNDLVSFGLIKCFSDFFLSISVQESVLQQLSINNDETYLYSFNYANPNSIPSLKNSFLHSVSTHCTELSYLFKLPKPFKFKFDETDLKMVEIMTKLWSNFAKYGDPNGNCSQFLFKWLPVDTKNSTRYLSIKPESELLNDFQEKRSLFWINLNKN